MNSEAFDAVKAGIGPAATYTGASVSGLGWFLSNEFFGLAGVAIGLMGLLISWHYKRQAHGLRVREHELRADLLRRGRRTDADLGELGADE